MPFLLLRNFPNDFVPDQRALWCLFGSIMNISGKEDKEDIPFSSYVPKRPPALPRWRLLSVFWGKQLSRGWFAVCQVEKFASTQKNDNASSSSSDNDDDEEEESSNINNKFPELWIGNKQLEVLALSDKIAQSTIGMVDVTATAKEMMHKERDMKRSMKSGTGNDNGNSISGGGNNNKKFDSSSSATRRSRQDGDDGGKPKKKKIQFALGDNDDNNKKSHEDENHNQVVDDSGIPDHTTDAAEVSTKQQTAAAPATSKKSNTNKHVFGKDCCQICGSKAHFTRKCPHKSKSGEELEKVIAENNNTGSVGVAVSSKSEDEQQPEDTRSTNKKESTASSLSPAAAAAALPPTEKKKQHQHNFGPDCCQKCGDKSHFTRKCPHKNKSAEELEKVISGEKSGAVAAVSSSTFFAPAVVDEEEKSVKKQKKSASPAKDQQQELPQAYKKSPEQKPAAVVKKPVPKFTDPDACKFCGAKDHFSRKCPNKNKQ